MTEKERRIGVFICHCGGNISDYVDVERVREAVSKEPGVVEARCVMFACSDASQQEMIDCIKEKELDGLVVASCSPKLHLFTFRSVAERAGLNPYQYVQVNLREQCSWAHRDEREEATRKGIRLVRAGVAKTALTRPLSRLRIETKPAVLVVGAGVAGLRASLTLADMGLDVYVVESEEEPGGWTARWGRMFSGDKKGESVIRGLMEDLRKRENITLFTGAEVLEKSGSVGDFDVKIRVGDQETIDVNVGAVIVSTGFDSYTPGDGEYGYGAPGVLTLPEFRKILDAPGEGLVHEGRKVRGVVYIYCAGSRQVPDEDHPEANTYCSRYCCTAAVHAALLATEKDPEVNQFHLFRDMRTYGKYEIFYEKAARKGSVFLRFEESDPPEVERADGMLTVRVRDQLAGGEEVEIPADLVVLVTGMVPRRNAALTGVFKLPLGKDGFFNEIHPKLRPVETVIDGVFIAGAAQGPKTMAESVASSMAAVSKCAALLLKGYVDLEPFVAEVDGARCTGCMECLAACPYDAIEKTFCEGRETVHILPALCKGGGACVPVCPEGAIDLKGYSDAEVRAMIDSLVKEVV